MFIIPDDTFEIKKTDKKGRGAFARRAIGPGVVIGDYLGTIIDPRVVDAEEDKFHEELYYALINDHQAILPDKQTVGVHFINHSCEPNVAFYPYNGHILYVSLRTIFPGEELTVNYLIDPEFGELNFFICHCGTPTCRGTWYIHPSKMDAFESMFQAAAAGQTEAEKKLPYGALLPQLPVYPTLIEDDVFYDLFGSSHKPPSSNTRDSRLPTIAKVRKIIRETGTQIHYELMNMVVRGVMGDLIIATTGRTR